MGNTHYNGIFSTYILEDQHAKPLSISQKEFSDEISQQIAQLPQTDEIDQSADVQTEEAEGRSNLDDLNQLSDLDSSNSNCSEPALNSSQSENVLTELNSQFICTKNKQPEEREKCNDDDLSQNIDLVLEDKLHQANEKPHIEMEEKIETNVTETNEANLRSKIISQGENKPEEIVDDIQSNAEQVETKK